MKMYNVKELLAKKGKLKAKNHIKYTGGFMQFLNNHGGLVTHEDTALTIQMMDDVMRAMGSLFTPPFESYRRNSI